MNSYLIMKVMTRNTTPNLHIDIDHHASIMSGMTKNNETEHNTHDKTETFSKQEKPKLHKKSSLMNEMNHESDAEVFLNLYAFKPSTVPPFALVVDADNKNGTNTQKRFNQKRHVKQKEKILKIQGTRSSSSSPLNEGENTDLESSNSAVSIDQMSHWNNFMGKLNYIHPIENSDPSYELKSNSIKFNADTDSATRQRRNSLTKGQSTFSSSESTSDVNFDENIVIKSGDFMYNKI